MTVDVKSMSTEQMKDKFIEIKIENLKNIEAKKQLKLIKSKNSKLNR